jgi:hypothetical protein
LLPQGLSEWAGHPEPANVTKMAGLLRACIFMGSEASFWINLPPELPEADDLKAIMALPPIVKRVPSSSPLTKMMRDFAQEEN